MLKKQFLLLSMLYQQLCCLIYIVFQDSLMNGKFKETAFIRNQKVFSKSLAVYLIVITTRDMIYGSNIV